MGNTKISGEWARSAQLLPAMYAGVSNERWSPAPRQGKGDQDRSVATCVDCGGKYRPAGGPCIHEHPHGVMRELGPVCCLVCGEAWRPGHACVAHLAQRAEDEIDEDIARQLDGWSGGYDWRRGLAEGEVTVAGLLQQLANLAAMTQEEQSE
jgi:hypothetical protein